MSGIAQEWRAIKANNESDPLIRILPDDVFEDEVDKRSTAYKQYEFSEQLGKHDYSEIKAFLMRFQDSPDELIIRSSFIEKEGVKSKEVVRAGQVRQSVKGDAARGSMPYMVTGRDWMFQGWWIIQNIVGQTIRIAEEEIKKDDFFDMSKLGGWK
jgi:hypothetical protein